MSEDRASSTGSPARRGLILSLLLATVACGGSSDGAPETSSPSLAAPAGAVTTRPPEVADEPGPLVTFSADGCSSSVPGVWSEGPLPIEISNEAPVAMALTVGTYDAGAVREDLVSFSENLADLSVRPDFVEVLEIYEVFPGAERRFVFDHGPGRYFMTCLRQPATMIVLDDVTIGG